jgi:uncharacterized protein YqgQ
MERDGEQMLKEFGRVVVFRNKQMIALIDQNQIDEVMIQGGFEQKSTYRVRWLVKKGSDLYLNPPSFGEQMEVYGAEYTIISKTYRPPSPWVDTIVQNTT